MRRLSSTAAIALAVGASALAEGAELVVVKIERPAPVELRRTVETMVHVPVSVRRGYHVQANPVLDPALTPITLTIERSEGLEIGAPRYPTATRFRLQGADDDLVVLDGGFSIQVPVRVSSRAAAGKTALEGKLSYQACDDEHCLFPRTLPVEIPLRIER